MIYLEFAAMLAAIMSIVGMGIFVRSLGKNGGE